MQTPNDDRIGRLEATIEQMKTEHAAERRNRSRALKGMVLAVVVCSLALWAGSISAVPNTFESGTTISSSDVNANFEYLDARVLTRDTVYTRTSPDTMTPNTVDFVDVSCRDTNDVLLSGGCRGMDGVTIPYGAFPFPVDAETAQTVRCQFAHVNQAETVDRDITAYAVCLDVP